MSIKLKLTIIFLAIALIPTFFVGVLTFNNYEHSLEATHLSSLRNLVAFKTDKIEAYFNGLKANIEIARSIYNIEQNLPVLTRLANGVDNPEFLASKKMLDAQLQEMQAVLGLLDIMLVNSEGKVVYSSNPEHFSKNFLKALPDPLQKAFEQGKDKIYFTDIFPNEAENNKLGMLVTAPVFDFGNSFIGVIAFELDMAPVYSLIQDATGLGNTGEILLGKKIGNQVVYLNKLRHDPQAALQKRITIGDKIGRPIQEAAQGKSGAGTAFDYRGKQVVAAWKYIPSLDWGVVAKIDTQEAFADVINLKNLIIIILAIIFVLAGIMAFSIAQSISGPIKKLSKGAEIVGSGNLDYKVAIDSKDEIGQLSRVFDKMTAEQKVAQDSLRQASQYARSLIEASLDPLVTISADGKITDVNEATIKATGLYREQLIGTDFSRYFTEPQKAREGYQQVFAKGFVTDYPLTIRHKDGHLMDVLYNASVYKDSRGNILGVFAAARDITELKKAQEALLDAQKEMERAKRLSDIGTLAATVAHELRNPLAAINMAAYNIKRKAQNPLLDKHLSNIETKVSESEQIIANLLFYSRIKMPHLGNINIHNILSACIGEAQAKFSKRAASTQKNITDIKNLLINADALQMKEVFLNILNNAFDALPEQGGRIEVIAQSDAQAARILFSDNGAGIDKENLERIFEPFFTTKAKGTGLGLTVCKQIIDLHGGYINIESTAGKGTTVTITLPKKTKE
jgi:PAS domain S-box-containing protein